MPVETPIGVDYIIRTLVMTCKCISCSHREMLHSARRRSALASLEDFKGRSLRSLGPWFDSFRYMQSHLLEISCKSFVFPSLRYHEAEYSTCAAYREVLGTGKNPPGLQIKVSTHEGNTEDRQRRLSTESESLRIIILHKCSAPQVFSH